MKKKLILFLFSVVFCVRAFSYSGVLSGSEGKLFVINTEHFDIIYPQDCRKTAEKIAGVAEPYYKEISEKLGFKENVFFPVTVTKQVEYSNAYFSMAPYNHIVIYDSPDLTVDDFWENKIESVFYHELVHGITFSMKGSFWKGISIFADFLTPAGLSLSKFWFEGAAVSFESMEKGGRLNSPFFTQVVAEAKLSHLAGEKKFPSWRDVSGARDVYPYGNDAYSFGSCFADYLQKKYGMEKYAEFWNNAGNFFDLSFCSGIFKKTYGCSLDDAWQDFYDAVSIPDIDFSSRRKYFQKEYLVSKKKAWVSACDSYFDIKTGKTSLVWFDSFANGIFLDGKKIFDCKNVWTLKFLDGENICAGIYKTEKNTKEDFFIFNLTSRKIEKKSSEIREKLFSTSFDENGSALIEKKGLEWFIKVNINGRKFLYNPGKFILQSMHKISEDENEVSFIFLWAPLREKGFFDEKGMSKCETVRAGKFVLNKNNFCGEFFLQSEDMVFAPIDIIAGNNEFYVVSENFGFKPLRKIEINWNNAQKFTLEGEEEYDVSAGTFNLETASLSENGFVAKKFNGAKYFFHGAKLPVGDVRIFNHSFEDESLAFLGGSFVSSTPWTSNIFLLSCGWNPFLSAGGMGTFFESGNSSTKFNFYGNLIFGKNGFLQSGFEASFSDLLWQGYVSSLTFELSEKFLYGNSIKSERKIIIDSENGTSSEKNLSVKGITSSLKVDFIFSTIRKTGWHYNMLKGIYLKPHLIWQTGSMIFFEENFSVGKENCFFSPGFSFGARIPFVFPLGVDFFLAPQKFYPLSWKIRMDLFTAEIQKGIPALSMYLSRINLFLLYSSVVEAVWFDGFFPFEGFVENIKTENFYLSDLISLKAEITLIPNTGYFADKNFSFALGFYLGCNVLGVSEKKLKYGFYGNIAL